LFLNISEIINFKFKKILIRGDVQISKFGSKVVKKPGKKKGTYNSYILNNIKD